MSDGIVGRNSLLYFAYGSNLSSARMGARVPAAALVARAELREHRLLFHKIGRDGSAKCDACFTGAAADAVLGVVYRLPAADSNVLDRIEGLGSGYARKQVAVVSFAGAILEAFTYCATRTASGLQPFHWYREHVLRGTLEHGLPAQYIASIEAVSPTDDPGRMRAQREISVHARHLPPIYIYAGPARRQVVVPGTGPRRADQERERR